MEDRQLLSSSFLVLEHLDNQYSMVLHSGRTF